MRTEFSSFPLRSARGVTLVELVISMVVISVAVTGVLLAFSQSVASSADPMIDAQALAISEAYMDEILAKPVAGDTGCTAGIPRDACAVVGDYHGINQAPTDQFGNAIAGLANYNVAVTIAPGELGIGDSTVVVATTHTASGRVITLRSHKVDY